MSRPRQYRQVVSHPAESVFPPGCPPDSPRSDHRGYEGVHVRVWVDHRDGIEAAVYRPMDMPDHEYGLLLRLVYDQLLCYRGLPERVHPDGIEPVNTDHFRVLDIGADKTGVLGPSLASPHGRTATLEELTEAAVWDLRKRLSPPLPLQVLFEDRQDS